MKEDDRKQMAEYAMRKTTVQGMQRKNLQASTDLKYKRVEDRKQDASVEDKKAIEAKKKYFQEI